MFSRQNQDPGPKACLSCYTTILKRYSLAVTGVVLGGFLQSETAFPNGLESPERLRSSEPLHYEADWQSLDQRPVPEWWRNAKFGVFVHWGVYSVPAFAPTEGEGSVRYAEHYWNSLTRRSEERPAFKEHHERFFRDRSYPDFASQFRAEYYNPTQWAELFKKSGARYVVLTAKHHDGFALWPSEQSVRWNSVELGPHRDLVGEFAEAVKASGLHMGLYYSLLDWNHPLCNRRTADRWATQMNLPEMKDLVTRYHPDILWTDGEWRFTDKELRSEEFLAWLYNESPVKDTIVVNDRWGRGTRWIHGGHRTSEYGGLYTEATPDFTEPWEECRGIGYSFGYNRFETAADYMTSAQLIELLVDVVSRGGNLLLNIGPKANGLIPVVMEERLLDIGRWLEVNGEAIYGSKAWRDRPENMKETKIYFTKKPDTLYVICTSWPQEPLLVDHIDRVDSVTLLGSALEVDFSSEDGRLTIQPPVMNPGNMPCEFAWTFKILLANQ